MQSSCRVVATHRPITELSRHHLYMFKMNILYQTPYLPLEPISLLSKAEMVAHLIWDSYVLQFLQ